MKFILLTILSTIIIFFVWNILKRLFFTSFYQFPPLGKKPENKERKSQGEVDQKLNWDAQTVEYEEINESKNEEKK